MKTLEYIDSHTGGEPTRLVVSGGPDLGGGALAERLERFRAEHDDWRAAIVTEPRGSDVVVGALLCEPVDPGCAAGVIFFNNVGYLGMCGHGTIGLVRSLAHLGRIGPGAHRIETPVGVVEATLNADGSIAVRNVPAYRYRRAVTVDVPAHGPLVGDIAWGGNWFFLVAEHGRALDPAHLAELTAFTSAIRDALVAQGITGARGALIDHIELFGPPSRAGLDSRNFVLCPGRAYDRSPCGTGTSAKAACLAADGKLAAGGVWRQESIIGSVFEARYAPHPERIEGEPAIVPTLTGRAHIMAEGRLCFEADDPFARGIRLG
ncbi:4-hydroxyproline epimerase [Burkholderia sp. FERM BP-3421]|jgi:4-hydroxyproline epimerase|uniref:4-hydroxyproline epimerase n=1 Tax=Burkholderia sp. FERM BP-3421 TaxID=1494466 RepID=UPI00235F744E|nr:4-hydroxyproline epimerase [Burkholderia sp. FERM BP-3421]WDD91395.1 4-hydroxyproline epimerase [Burkholderia sp. FERM BP-3421]